MADRIADFHDPLQSLLRLLEDEHVPHVLIGGLAVSQLSRPRLTADIDVLAYIEDDARITALLQRAPRSGFSPRIEAAERFARRNRVLLLVHRRTGIHVDISLGLLPFEREVIENRRLVQAGDLRLPLPRVEDLVILKAVAHRPVDLQDIRMLVESHPKLDQQRVRAVVSEFAAALEMPEILEDLLPLLP
jgi:predicted nucleotidyltransferase